MPLDSIQQLETREPLHADSLGLNYHYPLGQDQQLELTYWADASGKLTALNANIYLVAEAPARNLYRELVDRYTQRSGREPLGSFGAYRWPLHQPSSQAGDTVWLRLHESRQAITLNLTRD